MSVYRYHVRFWATVPGRSSEHVRVIELDHPIEYDSDILAAQADIRARHGHGGSVTLLDWKPLKGLERPTVWHCGPCRLESGSDRPCDVCGQTNQCGPMPPRADVSL